MMKKSSIERYFWIYILAGVIIAGCGNKNKSSHVVYDSPKKGAINISADESFKPVISEQIKVYESSYPGTKISASYKSEADCFRDLQKDSTRMIIVAKPLTEAERKAYETKLSYKPPSDIIAYDAVSVIINNEGKDSLFTLEKLKKLLTVDTSGSPVAVDGNN